jgi:xylulokinase
MLPYFDGERTPNLPGAAGELHGMTRGSLTPENLAGAAVLAVANSLADCLEALRELGAPVRQVLLIGGGARSIALRSALAETLGLDVIVPSVREYVAIGAARQAAWAATGKLPQWGRQIDDAIAPTGASGPKRYRARYAALRNSLVASQRAMALGQ